VASSLTQTMDPTVDVESAKHHGSNASNTEELVKELLDIPIPDTQDKKGKNKGDQENNKEIENTFESYLKSNKKSFKWKFK